MLQINKFAKLCHCKASLLRYYDSHGILVPCYIDDLTGYRYYQSEQALDFYRIKQLQSCGLSIKEIKACKNKSDAEVIGILNMKLNEQKQIVNSIENLIHTYQEDKMKLEETVNKFNKQHLLNVESKHNKLNLSEENDVANCKERKRANVKKSTQKQREQLMRLLKEDKLGARSFDTIKPSDAKEWALRMKDKGFSYNTINNHKRSLKASFYIAIQDDYVRKNPFDFKLSEVLENDTKKKVALTEEQEQALLSFIKTDNVYHKHYDDVLILLKTGLRISELCGLTVADIDFKNEVVIIDHQLLKSKEQGYYIETPKTKSGIRQVPLSKETIQAFQQVMKKRPKAEPFVIDGRGNFLFVNHKGKPKVAIDYNALFIRMVKKYNKHHKDNPLPHITPHTLRHTFCTRLASKNMNPKDLQYIMGHSNISITMNWYAHASIDTAKSEVQRLIA